jgi:hypothetical protein
MPSSSNTTLAAASHHMHPSCRCPRRSATARCHPCRPRPGLPRLEKCPHSSKVHHIHHHHHQQQQQQYCRMGQHRGQAGVPQ